MQHNIKVRLTLSLNTIYDNLLLFSLLFPNFDFSFQLAILDNRLRRYHQCPLLISQLLLILIALKNAVLVKSSHCSLICRLFDA